MLKWAILLLGGFIVTPALAAPCATGYSQITMIPVCILNGAMPPVINSALTDTGTVGVAYSYTITATNSPTSFNATGLPGGLSVNTSTGVISGTPTTAATTNVALSATNSAGTGTATLALTINPALAPGFYVATTGNDANPGTLASPFLTLHQCKLAMEGSANKNCYIRAGNYAPPAADASICNGTTTCAVALQGGTDDGQTWSYYPPDGVNSADITGGSVSDSTGLWDIFFVFNSTGTTINGLKLHNFRYSAISSQGGNHTLLVTNNAISNGFCVYGSGACGSSANPAGIQCYGCVNAVVTHNTLDHMASFGISFNNVNGDISNLDIENNNIDTGCTALADCGSIYLQDLNATATNIKIKNNRIHDGNTFATSGNFGSGLYLDDCTSNVTASENVITGKNGLNTTHIHGGNNNVFQDNLIDLSTFGQRAMLLQTSGGAGCSAGTMSGNQFKNSIIISGGGGGGYTQFGSAVNAPTIQHNDYFAYAGATPSSGGSYSDASPVTTDPQLSCWVYNIAGGSPVLSAPVSFVDFTRGWGPPGFVIPQTGTVPSSPHSC